ncbi:MAG TPA: nitrite reductase large subunit NirB, partial [Candidatus Nanopelagicaceae bacterium]
MNVKISDSFLSENTQSTQGARRVLVIGNGMVGHHFAQTLRARDVKSEWHVTVVGDESHPAYDRVGMSSYLRGKSVADLALNFDVDADDPGLNVIRGQSVVSLNRRARTAITDLGTHLPYDVAVFATGSKAFLPPVEGHDLPGVFVYRTIDDLDAIRNHAVGATVGVVVGGGLLGLEAADALRALNIETNIVELAPRLMPVQIDEGGGHALLRHVRELGITVHLERMIKRVTAGDNGSVAGVEFTSGESMPAQIVVFAVGIRPRDELGAASDLALGERGGIMVDRFCRTEDPAVYAIGEVAAVEGRTFGLVAPGYTMSTCVVTQLVEGQDAVEPMADPDMSTKLKLLGVDVASFGDAHGVTPGSLSLAWTDQLDGVYKKLVVTDDASTVLGGVLVGDASAFASLRALVGHPLPAPPAQLIAPTSTSDLNLSLPDSAQVCSCHAVTKGAITTAITEEGCSDVAALKKCTKAGTGCGSCIPLLSQLLSDAGVAKSHALCEHFEQSRVELFHIVQVSGIRRFSELIQKHGVGSGCDICKPAVASMLSSLGHGHLLDKEQRPLQDTNDKFLANIQRNGTYSVIPRIPGGEITPAKLIVIGEVARDFGLYTKITGGQRIDLLGARVEQLPAIWHRLLEAGFESGHAY